MSVTLSQLERLAVSLKFNLPKFRSLNLYNSLSFEFKYWIYSDYFCETILGRRKKLLYPNDANVGRLQIPGVKGDVVVLYFELLTTQKLKSSGVPEG